ncbi:osmoprotectant transport system ATP-binding protein [Breznakia sp. PF5-3]|uniref:ABC transporter ATP-binding protein n=1 Tax=unclassified Breznakia TaxID=2623764 RepID=UPI0024059897|nr:MULTISPECIES: ABC transporter ATP-binding protein [unclassified Breznakia]MDL2276736.1 ABC transporter ATP-binding protein [Breznakia sp. OttesenSCG-928-G09]MDF9825304.1 osmoprotectant transport system ATP-binding protein [Breznakia sp. PM6-1]MDF9836213.1 osmoprotectant transport system ATP-binding protein [Breznakia sp. PF5-3]MDF9838442.1 osmoprotectant transport system ATP-binding protein [Breznakia sp. PFB2-8]MDF9860458.1 osmoprotectant transport system ATP-binding protein [Breznakia sp.
MEKNIIKFEHACKSYGDNVIIPDFNLSIKRGEFVTLVGTSGSGKTTLLKMINGLISLDSGTIYVDGKDIQKEDLIQLRRNIGYAIQGSGLFPHMSVRQNIAYVPNLLNKKNKEKTIKATNKWIKVVGLDEELLDRYPDELSGGQQQRVGIARSLAASPDILLMDEPFGAVDEITRKQLQAEIKRIHKETNVTIVFVTHDINEAMTLGTKVLVLEKGEIAQYDTPENIMKHPADDYVSKLVNKE